MGAKPSRAAGAPPDPADILAQLQQFAKASLAHPLPSPRRPSTPGAPRKLAAILRELVDQYDNAATEAPLLQEWLQPHPLGADAPGVPAASKGLAPTPRPPAPATEMQTLHLHASTAASDTESTADVASCPASEAEDAAALPTPTPMATPTPMSHQLLQMLLDYLDLDPSEPHILELQCCALRLLAVLLLRQQYERQCAQRSICTDWTGEMVELSPLGRAETSSMVTLGPLQPGLQGKVEEHYNKRVRVSVANSSSLLMWSYTIEHLQLCNQSRFSSVTATPVPLFDPTVQASLLRCGDGCSADTDDDEASAASLLHHPLAAPSPTSVDPPTPLDQADGALFRRLWATLARLSTPAVSTTTSTPAPTAPSPATPSPATPTPCMAPARLVVAALECVLIGIKSAALTLPAAVAKTLISAVAAAAASPDPGVRLAGVKARAELLSADSSPTFLPLHVARSKSQPATYHINTHAQPPTAAAAAESDWVDVFQFYASTTPAAGLQCFYVAETQDSDHAHSRHRISMDKARPESGWRDLYVFYAAIRPSAALGNTLRVRPMLRRCDCFDRPRILIVSSEAESSDRCFNCMETCSLHQGCELFAWPSPPTPAQVTSLARTAARSFPLHALYEAFLAPSSLNRNLHGLYDLAADCRAAMAASASKPEPPFASDAPPSPSSRSSSTSPAPPAPATPALADGGMELTSWHAQMQRALLQYLQHVLDNAASVAAHSATSADFSTPPHQSLFSPLSFSSSSSSSSSSTPSTTSTTTGSSPPAASSSASASTMCNTSVPAICAASSMPLALLASPSPDSPPTAPLLVPFVEHVDNLVALLELQLQLLQTARISAVDGGGNMISAAASALNSLSGFGSDMFEAQAQERARERTGTGSPAGGPRLSMRSRPTLHFCGGQVRSSDGQPALTCSRASGRQCMSCDMSSQFGVGTTCDALCTALSQLLCRQPAFAAAFLDHPAAAASLLKLHRHCRGNAPVQARAARMVLVAAASPHVLPPRYGLARPSSPVHPAVDAIPTGYSAGERPRIVQHIAAELGKAVKAYLEFWPENVGFGAEPQEFNDDNFFVGARVVRSSHWHYGDHDGGQPGTVLGRSHGMWVRVSWDKGGPEQVYEIPRGSSVLCTIGKAIADNEVRERIVADTEVLRAILAPSPSRGLDVFGNPLSSASLAAASAPSTAASSSSSSFSSPSPSSASAEAVHVLGDVFTRVCSQALPAFFSALVAKVDPSAADSSSRPAPTADAALATCLASVQAIVQRAELAIKVLFPSLVLSSPAKGSAEDQLLKSLNSIVQDNMALLAPTMAALADHALALAEEELAAMPDSKTLNASPAPDGDNTNGKDLHLFPVRHAGSPPQTALLDNIVRHALLRTFSATGSALQQGMRESLSQAYTSQLCLRLEERLAQLSREVMLPSMPTPLLPLLSRAQQVLTVFARCRANQFCHPVMYTAAVLDMARTPPEGPSPVQGQPLRTWAALQLDTASTARICAVLHDLLLCCNLGLPESQLQLDKVLPEPVVAALGPSLASEVWRQRARPGRGETSDRVLAKLTLEAVSSCLPVSPATRRLTTALGLLQYHLLAGIFHRLHELRPQAQAAILPSLVDAVLEDDPLVAIIRQTAGAADAVHTTASASLARLGVMDQVAGQVEASLCTAFLRQTAELSSQLGRASRLRLPFALRIQLEQILDSMVIGNSSVSTSALAASTASPITPASAQRTNKHAHAQHAYILKALQSELPVHAEHVLPTLAAVVETSLEVRRAIQVSRHISLDATSGRLFGVVDSIMAAIFSPLATCPAFDLYVEQLRTCMLQAFLVQSLCQFPCTRVASALESELTGHNVLATLRAHFDVLLGSAAGCLELPQPCPAENTTATMMPAGLPLVGQLLLDQAYWQLHLGVTVDVRKVLTDALRHQLLNTPARLLKEHLGAALGPNPVANSAPTDCHSTPNDKHWFALADALSDTLALADQLLPSLYGNSLMRSPDSGTQPVTLAPQPRRWLVAEGAPALLYAGPALDSDVVGVAAPGSIFWSTCRQLAPALGTGSDAVWMLRLAPTSTSSDAKSGSAPAAARPAPAWILRVCAVPCDGSDADGSEEDGNARMHASLLGNTGILQAATWACPACGFRVSNNAQTCLMCGEPHPAYLARMAAAHRGRCESAQCPMAALGVAACGEFQPLDNRPDCSYCGCSVEQHQRVSAVGGGSIPQPPAPLVVLPATQPHETSAADSVPSGAVTSTTTTSTMTAAASASADTAAALADYQRHQVALLHVFDGLEDTAFSAVQAAAVELVQMHTGDTSVGLWLSRTLAKLLDGDPLDDADTTQAEVARRLQRWGPLAALAHRSKQLLARLVLADMVPRMASLGTATEEQADRGYFLQRCLLAALRPALGDDFVRRGFLLLRESVTSRTISATFALKQRSEEKDAKSDVDKSEDADKSEDGKEEGSNIAVAVLAVSEHSQAMPPVPGTAGPAVPLPPALVQVQLRYEEHLRRMLEGRPASAAARGFANPFRRSKDSNSEQGSWLNVRLRVIVDVDKATAAKASSAGDSPIASAAAAATNTLAASPPLSSSPPRRRCWGCRLALWKRDCECMAADQGLPTSSPTSSRVSDSDSASEFWVSLQIHTQQPLQLLARQAEQALAPWWRVCDVTLSCSSPRHDEVLQSSNMGAMDELCWADLDTSQFVPVLGRYELKLRFAVRPSPDMGTPAADLATSTLSNRSCPPQPDHVLSDLAAQLRWRFPALLSLNALQGPRASGQQVRLTWLPRQASAVLKDRTTGLAIRTDACQMAVLLLFSDTRPAWRLAEIVESSGLCASDAMAAVRSLAAGRHPVLAGRPSADGEVWTVADEGLRALAADAADDSADKSEIDIRPLSDAAARYMAAGARFSGLGVSSDEVDAIILRLCSQLENKSPLSSPGSTPPRKSAASLVPAATDATPAPASLEALTGHVALLCRGRAHVTLRSVAARLRQLRSLGLTEVQAAPDGRLVVSNVDAAGGEAAATAEGEAPASPRIVISEPYARRRLPGIIYIDEGQEVDEDEDEEGEQEWSTHFRELQLSAKSPDEHKASAKSCSGSGSDSGSSSSTDASSSPGSPSSVSVDAAAQQSSPAHTEGTGKGAKTAADRSIRPRASGPAQLPDALQAAGALDNMRAELSIRRGAPILPPSTAYLQPPTASDGSGLQPGLDVAGDELASGAMSVWAATRTRLSSSVLRDLSTLAEFLDTNMDNVLAMLASPAVQWSVPRLLAGVGHAQNPGQSRAHDQTLLFSDASGATECCFAHLMCCLHDDEDGAEETEHFLADPASSSTAADFCALPCGHTLHVRCLRWRIATGHLGLSETSDASSGRAILSATCPFFDSSGAPCSASLPWMDLLEAGLFGPGAEMVADLLAGELVDRLVQHSPSLMPCAGNCSLVLVSPSAGASSGCPPTASSCVVACPGCDHRACFRCDAKWHEDHRPATCKQMIAWGRSICSSESMAVTLAGSALPESDTELLNRIFILKNTVQCPQCHLRVEKSSGCSHLTCGASSYMGMDWKDRGGCGMHFCEQCESPLSESACGSSRCNRPDKAAKLQAEKAALSTKHALFQRWYVGKTTRGQLQARIASAVGGSAFTLRATVHAALLHEAVDLVLEASQLRAYAVVFQAQTDLSTLTASEHFRSTTTSFETVLGGLRQKLSIVLRTGLLGPIPCATVTNHAHPLHRKESALLGAAVKCDTCLGTARTSIGYTCEACSFRCCEDCFYTNMLSSDVSITMGDLKATRRAMTAFLALFD